jgi:uncharacterized membrane protein
VRLLRQRGRRRVSSRRRLLVATLVGLLAAVVTALPGTWQFSVLVGWDVAAIIYVIWMWVTVWPMNARETQENAEREDPTRAVSDALLVSASVASLVAVFLFLVSASKDSGAIKTFEVVLGIASVAISWSVVHTTYTVTYARLYYEGEDGGINFHTDGNPQYSDFAYVSFTVGMTFQVSDTDVSTALLRRTIIKQALLSYVFATVVVATTINLIANLSK